MNITWDIIENKYKHSPMGKRPNYKLIPVNIIPVSDEGMEEFNELYFFIKNLNWRRIVWTKRHYISTDRKVFMGQCWSIEKTSSSVELVVIGLHGYYRFQFRNSISKDGDLVITGTDAFRYFCDELRKDGVDLRDFVVENGMEIKKEIERPMIDLDSDTVKHRTWNNAHHIDFHSSHPAGMAKYYPELRPAIERIFERKENSPKGEYENKLCKSVLNQTWGYLQANFHGAKWAHIAKDAIHDTNERMKELTTRLIKAGRRILAWNTDGIWYTGEIYHGEGEGDGLGQWGHDHINCKLRFKSKGCYEYIENGEYHAVMRGSCLLDKIKPRSEWTWGDIYNKNAVILAYDFDYEEGVKRINVE